MFALDGKIQICNVKISLEKLVQYLIHRLKTKENLNTDIFKKQYLSVNSVCTIYDS